jgi:hypothetical protein
MHERLIPWAIRLLRTGIVPGSAVEDLTVGYGSFRTTMYEGLDEFLRGKHQKPIFVRGEWGTGKSHALHYLRTLASHLGLPTAFVSLNARSLALNYPQRLYGEIAASARTDKIMGVRALLEAILHDTHLRMTLKRHLASSGPNGLSPSLLALIDHFDRHASLDPRLESLWSHVLGEDLGWADYPYKRERALNRLEALAECFRAINGAGLVLLFDELETIDQLWNQRSRAIGYDVIARIAKLPSVWSVFAITDRFLRIVKHDSSLHATSANWISGGLNAGNFKVFDPPRLNQTLAAELAMTITDFYLKGYPLMNFSRKQVPQWVEEWGRNPSRNPRRLIRLVVNRLDLLRPLDAQY